MTLAERNIIQYPAEGLFVFQTDNTPEFYYYYNSEWKRIDDYWTASGSNIFFNSGKVGISSSETTDYIVAPLNVEG